MKSTKQEPFPGVVIETRATELITIHADRLAPGRYTLEEHGFDGFAGDVDSEEADAFFRGISGGPKDASHIPARDALGWLYRVPEGLPQEDPSGYLKPTPGSLMGASIPHGFRFALLSIGDVYRGPDHHHYQPIRGVAATYERAEALHWLTGLAPVELDPTTRVVELMLSRDFHPGQAAWGIHRARRAFDTLELVERQGILSLHVGSPSWPH